MHGSINTCYMGPFNHAVIIEGIFISILYTVRVLLRTYYIIYLTSSEGAALKAGDSLTLTVSRDVNYEVLASFTVGCYRNIPLALVATRSRGTCIMMSRDNRLIILYAISN